MLAAFNAGFSRVRGHEGVPSIPETMDYVAKIMADKKIIAEQSPYGRRIMPEEIEVKNSVAFPDKTTVDVYSKVSELAFSKSK